MMHLFVARLIKVMLQFLLRFPPPLPDGSHLLGGWRCMRVLVWPVVPQTFFVFVAHKGIVPPPALIGQTTAGGPSTVSNL